MAAEYGWTSRRVETELTDELMIMYLDEAADRRTTRATTAFETSVESVRIGTVFAHDTKAYAGWARQSKTRRRPGLAGESLERAIAGLAATHPVYVTYEPRQAPA